MPKYKLKEDGAIEGSQLPKGSEVILSELRAKPHLSVLELILDPSEEITLNETNSDDQPIEAVKPVRSSKKSEGEQK